MEIENFNHSEILEKKANHLSQHEQEVPWIICPWNDPFCDKGTRCCSSSYVREYANKNPEYKKIYIQKEREAVARINNSKINASHSTSNIDVYFHVVIPNPSIVTDGQLTEIISAVNNHFTSPAPGAWTSVSHNAGISFAWNTNDRSNVATNQSFSDYNSMKQASTGGSSAVTPELKVNIWICNLTNLLGFATFPDMSDVQGVVVTLTSLLPPHGQYPYNQTKTLTHELGHYFNLRHIWGDGDCSASDFVDDTPSAGGPNYTCTPNVDSCPSSPGVDMIENYMDYSEDSCMGLFTLGQVNRMRDCIVNMRPTIATTTTTTTTANLSGSTGSFVSCIKTKSIDVKKSYLGQNINFQNVITTQLEVFFINNANDDSLSTWITTVNSYFNIGSFLPALTIHGITFSNCRITSIDFPTSPDFNSNAISRGSLTLTIEEKIAGDLSNIINNSSYTDSNTGNQLGTLINSNAAYIDDISEDFNYSIGLNGQYNVTHTVNVTPNDSSGDLQESLGLTIAKALIDGYLPSSSFSSNSSIHSALRLAGVVGTLSASLNQITGEASYTRTINLLSNRSANFDSSFEHSHSLVLDKEGIITITESGKILPIEKDTSTDYTNAVSLLPSILSAARNRCVNVFSNYISKFNSTFAGVATVNPLGNTAIETSKNFNEINQEISYSASYSNNPNVLNGHTIDRTIDISKDSRGIANISEKTSFIHHDSKCSFSDPFELFNALFLPDVSGAFSRISGVWNDFNAGGVLDGGITYAFKLASRDVSFSPNGKSLNYSISYTSDKSISSVGSFAKNAGISKMSMDVSDKIPERIKQEFPIISVGMLVHDVDQTSLGSRTVSLSVNLDRNSSYGLNNPTLPTSALNYLANIARIKLLRVYQDLGFVPYPLPPKPTDIFIIECSYNFTSKRSLSFNVTAQYVQPR